MLTRMAVADQKQILHEYLQSAREVLLWKLAGLSDYDVRRPMTPTGTNLLGLVKHCAGVECSTSAASWAGRFPARRTLTGTTMTTTS
jgi:hypothetical protein